jgi:hypothetical protein
MNKTILQAVMALTLGVSVAYAATTATYVTKAGDTINGQQVVAGQSIQVIVADPVPTPAPGEVHIATAYTTGYTYWDNTPPGSAEIAFPVLHKVAGGTGTYTDPITIAVGHIVANGKDIPDYAPGTKMYIPNVRKYFIVEDACGDGRAPQNVPCHSLKTAPKGVTVWVDMWLDGQSVTAGTADNCAGTLTDGNGALHMLVINPASNYAVVPGSVIQNGVCATQFGNAIVTQ